MRVAEQAPGKRKGLRFALTLTGGIALGVAITILLQRSGGGQGEGSSRMARSDPAGQPEAVATGAAPQRKEQAAERRHFHVVLQTAEEEPRSVVALLLRAEPSAGDPRPLVFMPLRDLPLRGRMSGPRGQPVELGVVQADERNEFVLLSAPDASWIPAPREALVPSAVTKAQDLAAVGPDGSGAGQVSIEGRDPTGVRLRLSRALAPGTVVLGADDVAVAFCLGAREALPLDQTSLWLAQPADKSLSDVQRLLRSRDPEQLLQEASALLEKGATDPTGATTREGLRLIELALGLARDRKLLASIDEHRRFGWQQLVRVLARGDAASIQQAIEAAVRGLQLIPDHWPLMADASVLQLEHGDARQALALLAQLQRAAPEEAAKIAERFCKDLAQLARERIRERRVQDALELLDAVAQLFPNRADLLMARAEALAAAGRAEEAAAAATAAAALDPAFAQEAESLLLVAQRARTPGVVQIPFDPQTNVVHAQVSVGGYPLQLVVDTGATLTTIPSALADQLQLRRASNQRVKVNTASGIVEGEVVTLASLQIGSLEVKNVQAVVLDLPDTLQGKGLLGLNVLQRLDMEIDSQNGMLVLKQARARRGR